MKKLLQALAFLFSFNPSGKTLTDDAPEVLLQQDFIKAFNKAHKSGRSQNGTPDAAIGTFQKTATRAQRRAAKRLEKKKLLKKARLEQVEEDLAISDVDREEREHKKLFATIIDKLGKLEKSFQGLERKKFSFKGKLDSVQAWISRNEDTKPLKKTMFDRPWVKLGLALVIQIMEAVVMIPVFQDYAPTIAGAFALSFLFSTLLLVSAELIIYYKKESERGYKVALVLGIGILLFMMILRIVADPATAIFSAPSILLLYGMSVLLANRTSLHSKWFQMLKREAWLLKAMTNVTSRMTDIEQQQEALRADVLKQAKDNADQIKKQYKKDKIDVETDIKTLEEDITESNELYESYIAEKVEEIQEAFDKSRRERFTGDDNDGQPRKPFWKYAAIWSLVVSVFLSSCSFENPFSEGAMDDYKVLALIKSDDSASGELKYFPTPEELTEHLSVNYFKTDDLPMGKVTGEVQYSVVGNGNMMPTGVVEFHDFPQFYNRHLDSVDVWINGFESNLTKDLTVFYDSLKFDKGTNFYNSIAYDLNRMSRSDATAKVMYISSDCVGNDLYKHAPKPEDLTDKYDKVKAKLLKQVPLKDLSGIDVYIVYADERGYAYQMAAQWFFQRLFEEHGAVVEVLPNLL